MWPFQHRPRPHYTAAAEALILEICQRHGLKVERDESAPVELLFRIPVQEGLSVPIVAGLQNDDELNLSIGEFWSYFFPFEKVKDKFSEALDGFIRGECRVTEYRMPRNKKAFKYILEKRTEDAWETLYAHSTLILWWRNPDVVHITNEGARDFVT